jgi:galactofuranosylgalactofuranosylrhamnosyl-N-acetylglucosaminyl-diphospho-decaprenol beta-1,5/1,6-galactofuranosyltransferase
MTTTRLLQRQILPKDRDLDVLSLYVDSESAVLDADKYDVGGNRGRRHQRRPDREPAPATDPVG